MTMPDFILAPVYCGFVLKRRVGDAWPLIELHATRASADARIARLAPMGARVILKTLDKSCNWHVEVLS